MAPTRGTETAGQVIAVGVLAALAAPAVVGLAVVAMVGGPVALLAGLAVVLGLLYGIGTLTRHGSAMTGTAGWRVLWTLLVAAGGVALAGLGYAALRDLGVDAGSPTLAAPLVVLVFVLVAGVLTGRRAVALPAAAVLLATGAAVTTLLARDRPADDLAVRLAVFDTDPDLVFTTTVPGYGAGRPPQYNVAGPYTVTYPDPGGDPTRDVALWATRGGTYACEPEPPGGFPADYTVRCRPDGPGRWYVWSPEQHHYLESRGDRLVHVSTSARVSRAVLRAALGNARQVPAEDLDAVVPDVPEYLKERHR